MRHAITFVGLLGFASVGLYACSATVAVPTPDAGNAGGTDSGVIKADAKTDAVVNNGEGSSCEKAIVAAFDTEIAGALDSSGKAIYYKVSVTKDDYLAFQAKTADLPTSAGEDVIDTTITIYDASGAKVLATVDDDLPRYNKDAELIFRAPATETLCVKVTDFDSWKGDPPTPHKDPNYKFSVIKDNFDTESVNFDTEANDTIAAPQTAKLKASSSGTGWVSFVFGSLNSASDVDVYKFTAPTGTKTVSVAIPPIGGPTFSGKSNYGSTMERFTATVKKADGTIISEVTPPTGQIDSTTDSLTAIVTEGTDYYLVVSRPAALTAGANDFYSTRVTFADGNPPEAEKPGNNTNNSVATAEALTMTVDTTDAKKKRGFIVAYLPEGDNADSFSFAVGAGDTITLACGAARNGSGLTGFKAEVFVEGISKQSETESAVKDLFWGDPKTSPTASMPNITVSSAGTAVLQLSAGGRSTTNTGTFYLCGVFVVSP